MGAHAQRYMSAFEQAWQGHWLKAFARLTRRRRHHTARRRQPCRSAISCRCATIPACFSTPCIRCPIAATVICVDDNARALLLACALNNPGERPLPEFLTARFAALCNMRGIPRLNDFAISWDSIEPGSKTLAREDSHGRTLWALGECARNDSSPSRRPGPHPCLRRRSPPRKRSLTARLGLHASGSGCLLRGHSQ